MLRFTSIHIPKQPAPMLDEEQLLLIRTARSGMLLKVFKEMARRSPFTLKEWYRFLDISNSTMKRIRKGETRFTSFQTERIMMLTDFYMHGIKIHADRLKLRKWLKQPSSYLPKATRMSLLDTCYGIYAVEDELEM